MKKIIFLLMMVVGFVSAQKRTQTISGIVTDGRVPLNNVEIKSEGSGNLTYTDIDGHYSIDAAPGDKIRYSYVGFKSIEIKVEDVTRVLNIEMFPDITELEEVTVTNSNRKSNEDLEIEFSTNPNLIRSAYGILDATTSAYQIRILAENQINEVALCILGLLRGQFPGVEVSGDCIKGGSVSIRGANSLNFNQTAIFDVDGLVFNDAPIWILVGNIERVAVLPGLAARNLYGGIASGGVVIINTNAGMAYSQSKEIKDKARLRNNIYKGNAISSAQLFDDLPVYLQELEKSSSFDEAKRIYQYYAERYGSSYSYAIDAITYFKNNWNEEEFTKTIVEDTNKSFGSNPVALKALAYALEANGDLEKAYELYREVFIQRPNYAQSYMDLANSYRDLGENKKAASLYARYEYLVKKGFLKNDSTAFAPIIEREYNNLIALKGKEFISKNPKKHVLEDEFNATRLVFEWNDSEAEFELQFVNPEGYYSIVTHSLMANPNLIADEKSLGFSCNEFLIDESLPGNWQVNVKYLGNKSLTPTYLKVTTYYDYGSHQQRKHVDIYKLSLKHVNQELFKMNSTSMQKL